MFRFVQFVTLFFFIATTVADESKLSEDPAAQKAFQSTGDAPVHSSSFAPEAVPDEAFPATEKDAITGDGSFFDFGNASLPDSLIRTSTFKPKLWWQIERMWKKCTTYEGPSVMGRSRASMKELFDKNLRSNVNKHLSKSVGGMISEFGDHNQVGGDKCAKRPSLTNAQVQQVARSSFGIPDYEITYPPCNNGGKWVQCNYDGGMCCRRPQVEFIGRYYDTAVAAMALGATREEAFAPLVHARVLAYALESCDPQISFRGENKHNNFMIKVKKPVGYFEKWWQGVGTSLISFPVAYEVLYELYNTMLIERIRSRRETKIPTHAQMQGLYDALYYKKMMASATYMDFELNPSILFPAQKHFDAVGLDMATSSRLSVTRRMSTPNQSEVKPYSESELHPALRTSSHENVHIYEIQSKKWRHIDSPKCNVNLLGPDYYPYKFKTEVWSMYEGCCAAECKFMALYGRTFDVQSSNCCSGCNRYRCTANGIDVAEYFARLSTIEVSSKTNSGPEEFAFTV